MVKHCISLFVLLCFACTGREDESEKLTFEKQLNNTRKLRLAGLYLRGDPDLDSLNFNVYFLYEDGKILYFGSLDGATYNSETLTDRTLIEKIKKNIVSWGLYTIGGDTISFEKWHHSGGPPKITYIRKGKILNDSTFIITSSERPNGEERTQLNEVYHFRKFHPKPDSTNDFIK
jgi:hypothetical protein